MDPIARYYAKGAPKHLREAIAQAKKGRILDETYPYKSRMGANAYREELADLQIELVKLQYWAKKAGERIAIVFEGRDASGKGGTIKRFRENLNPRGARVVALAKPSDVERGQWYFQRYVERLPSPGEIVFFDRSWYNRPVVERVHGFCSPQEQELFYHQVPSFEDMLVDDGVRLIKIWLTVGRAEQLRRFLDREASPLKRWKLSAIDIESLPLWDDYSAAIEEMFARTHTPSAPWTLIRSDDKRRARIAAIRRVLSALPYDGRAPLAMTPPDPKIAGAPHDIPFALG